MNEDIFALFIGLVAVLMVSAAVLIPIVGMTARYALGSWIDRTLSLLEARQTRAGDSAVEAVQQVERRLSLLESQLEASQQQLREAMERSAFYERMLEPQLQSGGWDADAGSGI